jgi:hypothetical protein
MTIFETRVATSSATQPDPTKHVNYTLGMVLGVDDFTQEFAYLSGRDQWMARDLLGYGTACGLRVTIETGEQGPEVIVTAGAAVNPRGQMIRVPRAQCAFINQWLALDQTRAQLGSLGGTTASVQAFVVLCYRECRTDQVPVPGEPCRSEADSMAASRVKDDFILELRFDAPDQREEDALRAFVAWLDQVKVTNDEAHSTLVQFEAALRTAAHVNDSPPASETPPAPIYDPPPDDLRIPANDVCDYLRAAYRVWVTELRVVQLGAGQTAGGALPDEECVLLAELHVPLVRVGDGWQVSDLVNPELPSEPIVQVNEERRPFLLHLRMLQELIECGGGGGGAGGGGQIILGGDVKGDPAHTFVERLRGIRINPQTPQDGEMLTYSVGLSQWIPQQLQIQGAPVALPESEASITPGQVLTFVKESAAAEGQWQAARAPDLTLEGDVTGATGTNAVERIRGVGIAPMTATGIQEGEVLTFSAGLWRNKVPGSAANRFVERQAVGPYSIVAAGILSGDGSSRAPVYNGLSASVTGVGRLTVTFDGYTTAPDETFQYIVKAMALFNPDFTIGEPPREVNPVVSFDRFQQTSFVLHVADGGEPIGKDMLGKMEFMIEVSRYELSRRV